jgi:hypothetical protein
MRRIILLASAFLLIPASAYAAFAPGDQVTISGTATSYDNRDATVLAQRPSGLTVVDINESDSTGNVRRYSAANLKPKPTPTPTPSPTPTATPTSTPTSTPTPAPTDTPTPTPTASPDPTPAGVTLRAPDGGKAYFSQFLDGAPLDNPAQIIVANWGQFQFDSTFTGQEKDAGINLEAGVSGLSSSEWSNLKGAGINVLSDVRDQDATSRDASNTANVGWHYGDEADMTFGPGTAAWDGTYSYGHCLTPDKMGCGYTVMETVGKSQPDHRLRYMEYGKGVEFSGDGLSAGWEVGSEAARFVNGPGPTPNGYQDLLSAEVYWYTDADVNNFSQGGVYFNNGTANITLDQRRRASNYGLLVDNLRAYDAKDGQRQAVLGFVELGQTGSESDRAIQPAEVKAAVWHSMIAGARGIIYFPFSFAGPCVQLRIMADTTGCYTAVQAAVKQVDAQLQRLAPVLNDDFADGYVSVSAPCTACPNSVKAHTTQGVRAMAKFHDGHYYVFAGNNDNESKQAAFTLAGGADGTATVVDEDRTVPITGGKFSDSFASGTAIHIYRIDP